VKSAYRCLNNQPSGYMDDVFNLLWQSKATPKALTTTWRILLDRVTTLSEEGWWVSLQFVCFVKRWKNLLNICFLNASMHTEFGPFVLDG